MGDRHRHGHRGSRHASRERHGHGHRRRRESREGDGGRRHRHSSQERRSRSRDKRRDIPQSQSRERDSVSERPPTNEDDFIMTGGAGPVDTLNDGHGAPAPPQNPNKERPSSSTNTKDYQTNWRDLSEGRGREGGRAPTPRRAARNEGRSRSRSRSRSRHREPQHRDRHSSRSPHRRRRHYSPNPKAGEVGKAHSPTTKKNVGPDGTPFGSLPKYSPKAGLALGFGDHVMTTYKHIKAEHDAGHRSKGMLEKLFVKEGGGKEAVRDRNRDRGRERNKDINKDRGRDRGREEDSGRGVEWKSTAAEREAWERHDRRREEERKHGNRPEQENRRDGDGKLHKRPPTPKIRVVSPTPPNRSLYTPTRTARGVPLPGMQHQSPPPPAPDPPQWTHTPPTAPPPPIPSEPEAGSEQDGAAAGYHSQTPVPGSYQREEE